MITRTISRHLGSKIFQKSHFHRALRNSTASLTTPNYLSFLSIVRGISALERLKELAIKDEQFHMPKGAEPSRREELAAIDEVIAGKKIDQSLRLLALLALQENRQIQDPFAEQNLRIVLAEGERLQRVPSALVQEIMRARSEALAVWQTAKSKSNFSLLENALVKLVGLLREKAGRINSQQSPYDVLAEEYGSGLSGAEIAQSFDPLKQGLLALRSRILGVQGHNPWLSEDTGDLRCQAQPCDGSSQLEFARQIIGSMGFRFDRGSIDYTDEGTPQTSDTDPNYVRIMLKFHPGNVFTGIRMALRMGAHGIYQQHLPVDRLGEPVARPISFSFIEGHNFLWERHVGLSAEFLQYVLPSLRTQFPGAFDDVGNDDLYRGLHQIQPTGLRARADEIHYPLHIILRFEMERDLIDGKIEVKDLPEVWNQKMQAYMGIEPRNDSEGVLSDPHWPWAIFGRFPAYTLGEMMATQIFQKAKTSIPNLSGSISTGSFETLRDWLSREIYQKGSLLNARELFRSITGEEINPQAHLAYLEQKYLYQ